MNEKYDFIGREVPKENIDGEIDGVMYLYPYGYGTGSTDEENLEIGESGPMYATRNCYRVKLEERVDSAVIKSIRQFDTSQPSRRDTWVHIK